MALINCSECGREISDQALACPGCGAPVRAKEQRGSEPATPILGIVATGLGLGAVLMPYFAAVFFVPAAVICGVVAYRRGQTGWGAVGVLFGLLGLFYIVYVSQQISTLTSGFESSSLSQPPRASASVVTKAEYDRIREGMSYQEVRTIIGAAGEELSRSDIAGFETVMYSWTNANSSNMNAMFQNNRLVNKAQFGLR